MTVSTQSKELLEQTLAALDEMKALDVKTLDVGELSDFTDWMVLASGTSNRHVRSLTENLLESLKAAGQRPLGVEGRESSEWVLVDFGDVVVHVMQRETREFYDLERLWSNLPTTEPETSL